MKLVKSVKEMGERLVNRGQIKNEEWLNLQTLISIAERVDWMRIQKIIRKTNYIVLPSERIELAQAIVEELTNVT